MSKLFRIAGAQIDICLGDKPANLAKMESWMGQAAGAGAALVIFPECALTGYCYENLAEARPQAETLPGPSVARIADACRQLGVMAVFGMLERVETAGQEQLFNAAALVGPDGLLGSYRKIHLPHLGVDHFATPGDRPFAVCEVDGVRLGMNICYDSAFPESTRVMALAGADLIVLPTNFPPGAECVVGHVIHARAMENGVYFAAINRVGEERGFHFIGGSKICDPDGNAIAEAGRDEETLLLADVDTQWARSKLRVRIPGRHYIDRFADRRPAMYQPIVDPWKGA